MEGKTIDLTDGQSSTETSAELKNQQLQVLQEAIRNLQTQLLQNKADEQENLAKIADLEKQLKQAHIKELLLKTRIVEVTKQQNTSSMTEFPDAGTNDNNSDIDEYLQEKAAKASIIKVDTTITSSNTPTNTINVDEARLIGLVSTFLVVHPFGASIDYIYSYVQRFSPRLRPKELEEIISRYGNLFTEEVSGIGAQIERKWKFCGFDSFGG